MRIHKNYVLVSFVILVTIAAGLAFFSNRSGSAQTPNTRAIYSAKFLCGFLNEPMPFLASEETAVKPGNYATAVNVHNPLFQDVVFTKKAVISNPQDQPRGLISRKVRDTLKPDEALEIDCREIIGFFGDRLELEPFQLVKGFVVIEAAPVINAINPNAGTQGPLDVAAVNTYLSIFARREVVTNKLVEPPFAGPGPFLVPDPRIQTDLLLDDDLSPKGKFLALSNRLGVGASIDIEYIEPKIVCPLDCNF